MRIMYVAAVEVATRQHVDLDDALKTLSDYHPVLGTSPRGWVEVQINFAATGLAHACTTAAAIARAATGAEAIACQVMTEREYEARQGLTPGPFPGGVTQRSRRTSHGCCRDSRPSAWERPERQPGRHSA